jgi:hypothetical protein
MLVILATWEAEIEKTVVSSQPREITLRNSISAGKKL